MIDREEVLGNLERYDLSKAKIGVVASHSALDTCDGAVSEGFRTVAICQQGRESTFSRYFRTQRDDAGNVVRGVVDEPMVLDRFSSILRTENQNRLMDDNVIFVPNRSFVSYCGIDAVENDFRVPMFGSRNLLRSEERGDEKDYYWILEKAGLPYPKKVERPEDIDGLTIIKVHHKVKKLERGFFTAKDHDQFLEKSAELIRQGVIEENFLEHARMEQYIIGPVFNLDFFHSPLEEKGEKTELLGVDWRFETSLDGYCRLPGKQQMELEDDGIIPEYTVCGHNTATLRESLLDKAFEMAEKYVAAAKKHYDPGIIGPFCLQTCVDKDLNFYIYDVAPRIGGGTNVHMAVGHPYGNSLWRREMSTGRRVSMEIRRAIEQERVEEIIT
ncbi:MAG: formate--phosphoribosylaminoimidazolecarboxamide ligase family protein [Candidatus Methanomethylophilaceae archaeon]|jgi:5-formaminoimidazole-4-carboxamide-1-(beta)-D-ribofuranosyl 5'-monophosphate synthetase|nr:formate--phosphoribosylaminoimidazolecarboxamide ligase family protein [Candidatus Methanomethylophilaceae archaeon]NLF33812.1 formate--phosphoribosylaminoimidazolecarboxamide ligase family protein [Thermoplasmatales archaeon]